ncbi:unnamed protein product [Prunus armeniaca]
MSALEGKNYVWLDPSVRGILVIYDPQIPDVSFKQVSTRIPKWKLGQDLVSGKTLFHIKSENGLYPFRSPSSSSSFPTTAVALLGIRTSSLMWHQCLGHPSPAALSRTSSALPSPVPPSPPLVVSSSPVISPTPPSPSPQPPHSLPHLPTVTHVDVPTSSVESSPPPSLPPTHTMVTRLRDGIRKPNPKYANLVFLQVSEIEPTSFREANKSDQWR